LIGKTEKTEEGYSMKNVAIVLPAGQGKIGLAPFMPYCDMDEGLQLKDRHVVFVIDPVTEFANEYSTSFGSGLVVPSAGDVVGAPAGMPDLKLTT
tara:strand:+ start:537 stop:821 length:285 start_codon:yes stop_codon:yes gene_type:complete